MYLKKNKYIKTNNAYMYIGNKMRLAQTKWVGENGKNKHTD